MEKGIIEAGYFGIAVTGKMESRENVSEATGNERYLSTKWKPTQEKLKDPLGEALRNEARIWMLNEEERSKYILARTLRNSLVNKIPQRVRRRPMDDHCREMEKQYLVTHREDTQRSTGLYSGRLKKGRRGLFRS